jgi:hypothetical protein
VPQREERPHRKQEAVGLVAHPAEAWLGAPQVEGAVQQVDRVQRQPEVGVEGDAAGRLQQGQQDEQCGHHEWEQKGPSRPRRDHVVVLHVVRADDGRHCADATSRASLDPLRRAPVPIGRLRVGRVARAFGHYDACTPSGPGAC